MKTKKRTGSNVISLHKRPPRLKLDETVRRFILENRDLPHEGMSLEAAWATLLRWAEGERTSMPSTEAVAVILPDYFTRLEKELRRRACKADRDRILFAAFRVARMMGCNFSEENEDKGVFSIMFSMIERVGLTKRAGLAGCDKPTAIDHIKRWCYSSRIKRQLPQDDFELLSKMFEPFGVRKSSEELLDVLQNSRLGKRAEETAQDDHAGLK